MFARVVPSGGEPPGADAHDAGRPPGGLRCGSRAAAFVVMMKAAEVRMGHNAAHRGRLDRSPGCCVLVQAEVRACLMVIGEVRGERASQVTFVPDDHVVETLPTNGSDQPLRVGILPTARAAPCADR